MGDHAMTKKEKIAKRDNARDVLRRGYVFRENQNVYALCVRHSPATLYRRYVILTSVNHGSIEDITAMTAHALGYRFDPDTGTLRTQDDSGVIVNDLARALGLALTHRTL